MEDWTRVVLYGTYDGFTRSTVEPLQIAVRLDGGERVEIPSEFVISADQIVKKDEIKLRDVIKRIKDLDVGAREVWLNEILNELGSDFGSAKYKDGYEQGKLDGEWVGQQLKDADKIRLELNKPVVPQFVADWYEENKGDFERNIFVLVCNVHKITATEELNNFEKWVVDIETEPFQTLVNMHQFGYTVEKEKFYRVRIKGVYYNSCLIFDKINKKWFLSSIYENNHQMGSHTRKELEQAGFGWVFDCPGIEIEEVE